MIRILPKCRIGLRNCNSPEGITEREIVPGNLWFRQLLVGVADGVLTPGHSLSKVSAVLPYFLPGLSSSAVGPITEHTFLDDD